MDLYFYIRPFNIMAAKLIKIRLTTITTSYKALSKKINGKQNIITIIPFTVHIINITI